jgi:hypothetical protein
MDTDWNHAQMILVTALRRMAEWGLRSGPCAEGIGRVSGGGYANDFIIEGGASSYEASPWYIVGGLPAAFPLAGTVRFGDTNNLTEKAFVHRRCTNLTNTRLTDTASKWGINKLAGRSVVLHNVTGLHAWTIVANGTNWADVAGGANMLAFAAPGDRYYITTTQPVGANRDDTVWLDCYLDEIRAPLVGGGAPVGDPEVDSALNHNPGGATIECAVAWKVVQSLFVSHGGTSDISPTVVESVDGVYTLVDTDNKTHYLAKLAILHRVDGLTSIFADHVEDKRPLAGRALSLSTEAISKALCDHAVMSGFTSQVGGGFTTLRINTGVELVDGETFTLPTVIFDRPTGEAAAGWAVSTYYVVSIGAGRRYCVEAVAKDPTYDLPVLPSGKTLLCWFLTDGAGALPATATDLRRFVPDLAALLGMDSTGQLRASLTYLPQINDGTKDAIVAVVKDSTGAIAGKVYYDDSLDAFTFEAVGVLNYAALASGTTRVTVGGGHIVLGGLLTFDAFTYGPATDMFKDTQVKSLRAPAIIYGDAALALAPIALNPLLVPASEGDIWNHTTGITSTESASGDPHYHNTGFTFDPITRLGGSCVMFYMENGTGWAVGQGPCLLGNMDCPVWRKTLPVCKGDKLTRIRWRFYHTLANGAELTLKLKIGYDDPGAWVDGVPTVYTFASKTFYITGASAVNQAVDFDIPGDFDFGAGSQVSDVALLYATATLEQDAHWKRPSSGSCAVYFKGLQLYGEIRGDGIPVTVAGTHVSAPRRGF